jgi:hypothetical protein
MQSIVLIILICLFCKAVLFDLWPPNLIRLPRVEFLNACASKIELNLIFSLIQ